MSVVCTLNASTPSAAASSSDGRSNASTITARPDARAARRTFFHSLSVSSIWSKSLRPGCRRTTRSSERKSWNLMPSAFILKAASSIFSAASTDPPWAEATSASTKQGWPSPTWRLPIVRVVGFISALKLPWAGGSPCRGGAP